MIYKKSIHKQAFLWLKRFRHRKGYGIQSPQIFYFVREVILQSSPYYEFSALKQLYKETASEEHKWLLPRKRYELLFRIANEMQVEQTIEIGTKTGIGTLYIKAARKKADCILVNEKKLECKTTTKKIEKEQLSITQQTGCLDTLIPEILSYTMHKEKRLITYNCELFSTEQAVRQVELILGKSKKGDCFVISGLQYSPILHHKWKEWTQHPLVSASFDLYEAGILFFEPSFHQKCYLINY